MRIVSRRVALSLAAAAVAIIGVAAVVRQPPSRGVVASAAPAYPVPGAGRGLTIEVLHGSGRYRAARLATRQLRQAGFDVVFVSTDSAVRVSRVIARRVDAGAAAEVASALGIRTVVAVRDTLRRVDVSVWIGADYRGRGALHP